ncbi:MAG: chromate efflux transporter [Acholeplasmatales bacterium]|nr:MAG: chromate efflux transporter [Acholeplasmatales bacterium]
MQNVSRWTFLKDVLVCSLGAFGGPESHYGVFSQQLVEKRQYLTQEELGELIALTSLLPGPSSTQTLLAIGYKHGGKPLAWLTLLVWALPVVLVMTVLSFSPQLLASWDVTVDVFRTLPALALGFVVLALVNLSRKTFTDPWLLLFAGAAFVLTLFFRQFWLFPLMMLVGGGTYLWSSPKRQSWQKLSRPPAWRYFVLMVSLAVFAYGAAQLTGHRLLVLFDAFYRYGLLVIGGGQVLIPYMYSGLVEQFGFLSSEAFMTGYGLVQGLPGPMFSFSAYAGGLASSELGLFGQTLGALLSVTAIFLPAVLLMFFIFPLWTELQAMPNIKIILKGVVAVAIGLIASTGVVMAQNLTFGLDIWLVFILTVVVMLSKKIPAPLWVLMVIVAGVVIPFG